jgi:hypothetical protein
MSIREQHAAVVGLCEKALDETATFSSRGETYKALETWLDNVVSTLISWGTDIRIEEDPYTCIEDQTDPHGPSYKAPKWSILVD